MKEKITILMVCLLLLTTAIPVANSVKNTTMNATRPNNPLPSTIGSWDELQKLLASDGGAGDSFGGSVALSGDTAFIGALYDDDNGDNSGAVYVFKHIGTTWSQQQKLLASDGAAGDYFGCSVALSGDTALIGASWDDDNDVGSGSVYVFTYTGGTWVQQQKLLASDGDRYDSFGYSVALSGDAVLIGAYQDEDNGVGSGSVYVFTYTGGTWVQQQKLLASDGAAGDYFGCSVALSDNTALIGANWDDDQASGSGSAYVFIRTGAVWTQQQKLLASDGAAEDLFGISVALSGDTALIGACWDDDNGDYSGSAYVFIRTGAVWTQQQKLLASDGAAEDLFGISVALSGGSVLIGANFDDDMGDQSGSAYVFIRTGAVWTQQQKLLASDGAPGDDFGFVSLDGDTALIGANNDDDKGIDSGSVYVFTRVTVPVLDLVDIKGGLRSLSVVLINIGEGTAENITWTMNATGNLFSPKWKNGTIGALSSGKNTVIQIRPAHGLGKTSITFTCTYKIMNLSLGLDFTVKQEWRDRAFFFLDSFPIRIQPSKEWMNIDNYSYMNRSGEPGVEFQYGTICNMHNVRVILTSLVFSEQVEFLAACKFTNGTAVLHEGWITKDLLLGGHAHWELELVDGG